MAEIGNAINMSNNALYTGMTLPGSVGAANVSQNVFQNKTRKAKPLKFSTLLRNAAEDAEQDTAYPIDGLADLPLTDDTISMLLDNVLASGDALGKKQTDETLLNYKKAVKQFIGLISKNTFTTETIEGRFNLRKKSANIYTIVEVVDKKLERLAADIITKQMERIKLLARIEEINGMLVDMVIKN
jgi:uncharacterized protein YaaR (DUF327 family)